MSEVGVTKTHSFVTPALAGIFPFSVALVSRQRRIPTKVGVTLPHPVTPASTGMSFGRTD